MAIEVRQAVHFRTSIALQELTAVSVLLPTAIQNQPTSGVALACNRTELILLFHNMDYGKLTAFLAPVMFTHPNIVLRRLIARN
jgi:hypothetical protein